MEAVQGAFAGVPDVLVEPTIKAGHATEITAAAAERGAEVVVAAGGDGTVHEVVNGLLSLGEAGRPALGVMPLGSGCDYVKTFDIPADPAQAVRLITSAAPPRPVDAGEIVYEGGRRYFANIAEVGIGASVVDRARRLPRRLGGAVYGVSFLMTLPGFRRPDSRVVAGEDSYEGPLTNLVVAIAQVFGGGMRVAPNADPSDGSFDVQLQYGSKFDYVKALPKVYKGTHVPHPKIREVRAGTVEVRCDPPAVIEADGEVLGLTPARFRILPGALALKTR